MARKRNKPEEIVSLLRQAKVLHGQGMSMSDAIRQLGRRMHLRMATRCRRLAKDREKSIASSEAWINIAHIRLTTRLPRKALSSLTEFCN